MAEDNQRNESLKKKELTKDLADFHRRFLRHFRSSEKAVRNTKGRRRRRRRQRWIAEARCRICLQHGWRKLHEDGDNGDVEVVEEEEEDATEEEDDDDDDDDFGCS